MPTHVVVIVMENRSVDNLFHTLPGVDTVNAGLNSAGQPVPLVPVPLTSTYDPDHSHMTGFVTEYDGGRMDGFDREFSYCGAPDATPKVCPTYENTYAYVQSSDIAPYLQLAKQFAFADHVLQSNAGPSFPAHLYLIGAQSGRTEAIAENPSLRIANGGCSAPRRATVGAINLLDRYPGLPETFVYPCTDFPTIFDELDARKLSWKYYLSTEHTIWNAPQAVKHLYESPEYRTNVVFSATAVLSDIAQGSLANVSFVIPDQSFSDHARISGNEGPAYVATIANAVGRSPYWQNTALFVVWDDWGGWYDHYKSHAPLGLPGDPYEYGFRVPLIVVSPYVNRRGLIDHTDRDFTAILRFIERAYGLPTLGNGKDGVRSAIDVWTDDLSSMFDFHAAPLAYLPVTAGVRQSDFNRFRRATEGPPE